MCICVCTHACCLKSVYGVGARQQLGLAWITAPWLGHCSSDTPPYIHEHTLPPLPRPLPNKLPALYSSSYLASFCSIAINSFYCFPITVKYYPYVIQSWHFLIVLKLSVTRYDYPGVHCTYSIRPWLMYYFKLGMAIFFCQSGLVSLFQ